MDCNLPGFPVLQSPGVCWDSCLLCWWCYLNHFILCHSVLLLPSLLPGIRVFSSESALQLLFCVKSTDSSLESFSKNEFVTMHACQESYVKISVWFYHKLNTALQAVSLLTKHCHVAEVEALWSQEFCCSIESASIFSVCPPLSSQSSASPGPVGSS